VPYTLSLLLTAKLLDFIIKLADPRVACVTPSLDNPLVDSAVYAFILDTRNYREFCHRYFDGGFLEHIPEIDGSQRGPESLRFRPSWRLPEFAMGGR
jgi:hypothetical protein